MNLSVQERLVLLSILPAEGDLATLRIVRDLRGSLSFSAEELEKFKLHQAGDGSYQWDREADQGEEIAIPDVGKRLILDRFNELDKSKSLQLVHLEVYERLRDE